jgi:hypothetical protein
MIECTLPVLAAQSPAVMTTDLIGDRITEQALAGQKRFPSPRRCAPRRHRSAC